MVHIQLAKTTTGWVSLLIWCSPKSWLQSEMYGVYSVHSGYSRTYSQVTEVTGWHGWKRLFEVIFQGTEANYDADMDGRFKSMPTLRADWFGRAFNNSHNQRLDIIVRVLLLISLRPLWTRRIGGLSQGYRTEAETENGEKDPQGLRKYLLYHIIIIHGIVNSMA